MKRISLLPSDIKMQQRFRRKKVLYLAAGVLLLLCFLFLNGFYIFTARKMKSEITFLQQQRGLQQREIDALHEYAAILQQAETAEKLLEQAMGKEPAWDELLVSISLYVPPDLQLTALSAHGNGSNRELTLQGKASGRYTVADLLQGLHKMP